jgi:hypothetical protein
VFEPRTDSDGSHYVVEGTSGRLAHVEDGDGQRAAIGLTAEEAAKAADQLNREALS